jgi:hypothetical protein
VWLLDVGVVAVHLNGQTAMRKEVRSGKVARSEEVAVCPLRCTATSSLRATFLMADSILYECQPALHFVPLFSYEVEELAALYTVLCCHLFYCIHSGCSQP